METLLAKLHFKHIITILDFTSSSHPKCQNSTAEIIMQKAHIDEVPEKISSVLTNYILRQPFNKAFVSSATSKNATITNAIGARISAYGGRALNIYNEDRNLFYDNIHEF